ncbi:MAG TPA: HNH endonuclease signature motif containing protein [Mycobacterium sp.]|uniref:HNH endonuclease signature motif containing protein n=1 Tax=Mycobacterium sp. TaxID=1785 RepID=UPI002D2A208C|nr:HNH endonuclease signature motif containing protein [Mycobacterium sp.]HZU48173.1 HNH endonuclease signature motif containing protein [Mycobacterium sp.]
MRSNSREEIVDVFDALDAAVDAVAALQFDALTTPERFALLERCERVRRRLPTVEHGLINQIARQAGPEELGGKLSHALAEWVLVSRAEAARRIREAQDLGPRQGLTGERLPAQLAATAAAQRDGKIGAEHVAVIRRFCQQLPGWVDEQTRQRAEAQLARQGSQFRPDQLAKLADKLADCINPDGNFSDEDRARRRGLSLGKQDIDGMSPIRGWLTPEARATIEAVLAKLAAPGMCNAADDAPCVDGAPSQEAIERDTRSTAQRNHDGLNAGLRALLASGKLGQHNGLPASIVVTTTLAELEAGAGRGLTGGGSILPMSDVIRMATHAHHYLAIFDKGKALALYHTKRLASPGQRIVLYAKDRGCTAPDCDVPAYFAEVHHVTDFAKCRATDVNDLTLACGTDHRIVQPGGWQTRKRQDGRTEWIPPPHLDRGQPRVNLFHHPEELLSEDEEDDP